jgi:Protein of unknown function (DUF2630)
VNSREAVNLERRIEKLSEERIDLFARASANVNLTVVERTRLKTIERELDECYLVIRQYRAVRDAERFVAEEPNARSRPALAPRD